MVAGMIAMATWLIVGALAGYGASKVLSGRGMGLLWDIVVGILGAFLGGWLAGLVGISVRDGSFTLGGLIAALVGAVIVLVAFRVFSNRRRVRHI
jgi:uncharacterized membrane protein YeaQ/YmgE (transglycosylase-associated protein family)